MADKEIPPTAKLLGQTSVMFGGVYAMLKDIDPHRAKEALEAAQKHCDEAGYGDDLPRSCLNALFPDSNS